MQMNQTLTVSRALEGAQGPGALLHSLGGEG
jgi:hypothetical protein